MAKSDRCFGHDNNFQHLSLDLDGLDEGLDLGYKFDVEEGEVQEHPVTKVRAAADPILILHVSFLRPKEERRYFRYGLRRMDWRNSTRADGADREELLRRAIPQIASDLRAIKAGKEPNSLRPRTRVLE